MKDNILIVLLVAGLVALQFFFAYKKSQSSDTIILTDTTFTFSACGRDTVVKVYEFPKETK